jgi:ribulose 1,5-bisphosphate carboxylase large subunit-like protein
MDFQKYGISPVEQARVDAEFLHQTLDYLAPGVIVLPVETRDELEDIYLRTHTAMHNAVVESREVETEVLVNLGRLSFIDTMKLPSSEGMPTFKRGPEHKLGSRVGFRRLFAKHQVNLDPEIARNLE